MKIGLTIALISTVAASAAAQAPRHDGNWWRDRTPVEKSTYVLAFVDGMNLGNRFAYWGPLERKKLDAFMALSSFEIYWNKYIRGVRSDQLVDGLNVLYDDFQNRRIELIDGIWITLNGIAGTPKDDLEKMIEAYRRSAARPDQPELYAK